MASHRFCQSCLSAWSQFTDLLSLRVCWQFLKIHILITRDIKVHIDNLPFLPRKYFKRMPCTLQNQSFWAFDMLSRTSVSATPRQFGVLQKTVSWDVITARWLELFLTNPKVGTPWVTTQQPDHYISQTPAQQISAISSDCWHHPRAEKAKFLHCLGPSAWTRPMHKTSCCLSTAGTDRGHFQDGPMMTESWRQWSYDNLLYWLVSVFVQLNEISSGQISLHTVKKSQMLEWKLYLVSYFLCWI